MPSVSARSKTESKVSPAAAIAPEAPQFPDDGLSFCDKSLRIGLFDVQKGPDGKYSALLFAPRAREHAEDVSKALQTYGIKAGAEEIRAAAQGEKSGIVLRQD